MKINEIDIRTRVTAMIPKEHLPQDVRVKTVLNQTSLEKAADKFREDIKDALEHIKPEGFDEELQKFNLTTRPESELSEEEKKKAEELRNDPDYASFKEKLEKVDSDYAEAQKKIIEENEYDVSLRPYTDADLAAIAGAIPSGSTTEIVVNGKKMSVPNDILLHDIIQVLV